MAKVPVMDASRAAYRFGREAWRPALGALLLLAAVTALQYYWSVTAREGWAALATLLGLLAQIMAYGALFRIAFAAEHPDDPYFRPKPLGLQWSGMETRLLGAMLLLVLLALIAALLLTFVFIVAAMVVGVRAASLGGADTPDELAAALGPGGVLAIGALLLAILCAAIYIGVRLSLVMPATAAERKVQVFETWRLSRRQFWPILAALLITSAPTILLAMLNSGVTGAFGEERDEVVVLEPAAAATMAVLTGLVTGLLQTPLSAGLAAYLYRRLRGPDSEALSKREGGPV